MALPSCPQPLVPQFLLWSPPQRSCFSAQSFRQSSLRLNCSPRNKRPLGRGRMGAGSRISLTALRQAPPRAPRPQRPLPCPQPVFKCPSGTAQTGIVSEIPAFSPRAHRCLPCEIFAEGGGGHKCGFFSHLHPSKIICLLREAIFKTSFFSLPSLPNYWPRKQLLSWLCLFSSSLTILEIRALEE